MKASVQILICIAFIALTACSTQELKQDTNIISAPAKLPTIPEGSLQSSAQNPPLTLLKEGKTLNLVRIMDGGACKNDFQGAKGAFLIYADPADIDRIKDEKGPQIFSDFEVKIQAFSTTAFQTAIDASNLNEDPFALGTDEAQEKLIKQISANFHNSVTNAVNLFQQETSLTIDVVPFPPSFMVYQQGCDTRLVEPVN